MNEAVRPGTGSSERRVAAYLQSLLGAVAAIFLALLVPTFVALFRVIISGFALGLTASAGGILESFLSPFFWIFFLFFFSWFYLARRSHRRWQRVLFFWIPTCFATVSGFAVWGFFAHMIRMSPSAR